ncbi:curlin subunit CsgB [Vibrio ouci]|uniref:Curlin subunit CsgB n=1 Tax=Vibrio ouci TaxID=2499078 RepID=A0A4Y8WL37_9VIBR|nr:curlin subunit CsgB [Vibrio ouci]TFH93325.1 curlin subunit CsgB [Vibrio ouci]
MQNHTQRTLGFVVFSLLVATSAYAEGTDINYSSDMATEFGEFYDDSPVYSELYDKSVSYSNYAEVVLENTFDSEVHISQVNAGLGANKAKVVQRNTTGNTAVVSQSGSENLAVIEQSEGQDNYAEIIQAGYNHNSYISQNGSHNIAYLRQCQGFNCSYSDYGSDISIVQENNHNLAIVVDKGNSSYGIEQDGGDSIVIFSNMNRGIYVRQ